MLRRTMALFVLITMATTSIGCVTRVPVSVQNAKAVGESPFDAQREYEITFADGYRFRTRGENLMMRDNLIGIRFEKGETYKFYSSDQIQQIVEEKFSIGKTVGLAAGVAVAVVAGLITGIIFAFKPANSGK